jgi:hypothetical protein
MRKLLLMGLCGLFLSACRPAQPTPPATGIPTLPLPTLTPLPLATPTGSAPTLPPTDVPLALTPTPEPPCVNELMFVADVTVPDGAQFLPGQTLNKKWSVTNSGTCAWGPDYRLVLIEGNALGAATELALYPAKPGGAVSLEIPMTAPLEAGIYTGKWRARDPQGQLFGDAVYIKIEVIPLPTP